MVRNVIASSELLGMVVRGRCHGDDLGVSTMPKRIGMDGRDETGADETSANGAFHDDNRRKRKRKRKQGTTDASATANASGEQLAIGTRPQLALARPLALAFVIFSG
jgi:hypothetical protein